MRRGLVTLQRLRDLRERQALAAFAKAERDVRVASDGLAAERARHRAEIGRLDAADPGALVVSRLRGSASLDRVHDASETVDAAEAERDDRAVERTRRAIDRRSLDRLVERMAERERAAAEQAMQREADELATQRWEGR